ncbi:MAG: actin family protein [Candidatus Lokiarchaeota archaeon]|nr:actin family protein [Candidatus Harpocratesius repetitus]
MKEQTMENLYAIVMDIGQFSTKIGFGGENQPRNIFYTITGTPKYKAIGIEDTKQLYIGNEIIDSLGLYKVQHPIDNGGEITDWVHFEALIDYAFYLLRVDPSVCKVLFTTNPFLSRESKLKLFELFIERYQACYYPVRGSLLTMYSGGFDTGLVVDMGAANIRITPIYKGFILEHAIKFLPLGGNVLDQFMQKKMQELGISTESAVQRNLIRGLKEQACFCSIDFDTDLTQKDKFEREYELPDSSKVKIGEARFLVPELLFKPQLMSLDIEPIHKAIIQVVEECDVDIRRDLLRNIFLTGGSSMFPFLEIRLRRELEEELSNMGKIAQDVHIIAPKGRALSNWVGGSILSMIPDFQERWITRKKYYEEGISEELLKA